MFFALFVIQKSKWNIRTYARHTIAFPADLIDTHTLPVPDETYVRPHLDWTNLPAYLGGTSKPAFDVLSLWSLHLQFVQRSKRHSGIVLFLLTF